MSSKVAVEGFEEAASKTELEQEVAGLRQEVAQILEYMNNRLCAVERMVANLKSPD